MMCSFLDHLLTFSQTCSRLLVSLTPESPGWTCSSGCSCAEGLCTPLKLLPEALLTQPRVQLGSAASRAHCRPELPLSTTDLGVPACPGPFPQGSCWCCPVSHSARQAPSPAPFPGISVCPPKFPPNQVSSLPRPLWRAPLPSSTLLEQQAAGLAPTHDVPRTPQPTARVSRGSLSRRVCLVCLARGTELRGCHELPVAVPHLEHGGPGCPTARCSHSACLWCPYFPAGILGEVVLEASPKPASGHLAPLGCALGTGSSWQTGCTQAFSMWFCFL